MNEPFWHELFNELVHEPEFTENGFIFNSSLHEYRGFLVGLSNRFINECREICEVLGPNDLKFKLNKLMHIFRTSFDFDYKTKIPFDFHFFKAHRIIEENAHENDLAIIARAHFDALLFCIESLKEIIGLYFRQQRSNVKIIGNPFNTNLTSGQLQQIFNVAVHFGFIEKSCNKKTFIDLFMGRSIQEKINWIGTIFSLNYFIKALYQNNNKLQNGSWDAVSLFFTVSGHQVSPSSLKHPGQGKNDRIETLDTLIDHFKNPM